MTTLDPLPVPRPAPGHQTPLTLVTALYDLEAREPARGRRPAATYLRLYEYLRTVPLPMVVCAESHCLEAVRDRACAGPRQFVEVRLEESRYYDRMTALSRLRPMENAIHRRDTPLGFVAVSAKFDLMAGAGEANPFGSAAFAWIDWGGRHVMEAPPDWGALARAVAERVVPRNLALMVSMRGAPRAALEPRSEFYRWNRGLVAATFFAGTAGALARLRDRYTDEVERMIASGYLGMEEQVMGALAALHPEELAFTYSDYVGILANIDGVTRDVMTVLANLAACGEAGLHDMAVDVGRQVLSSLTSGRLRLEAPESEKLLFWLFVSAFYASRPLADDLALAAVMLHAEIPLVRGHMDHRRELWNLNLSFVGRRLGDPPVGWTDFLRSPVADPWLGLL